MGDVLVETVSVLIHFLFVDAFSSQSFQILRFLLDPGLSRNSTRSFRGSDSQAATVPSRTKQTPKQTPQRQRESSKRKEISNP